MNSNYYAVLMAGGIGSRFWPVSTAEFPKQFHDMLGSGQTLIQKTYERLSRIVPEENILVLTHERYKGMVLEQLPGIPERSVLLEPEMRNTAPCILYAALKIANLDPEARMIVAPSDHWIENEEAFARDLEQCFSFAGEQDALVTLGIRPTFPNTGYGYIEFDKSSQDQMKPVKQFREKPDYQTAKLFYESGNFLWNAGIFVWTVPSVLAAFRKFQPEMLALFEAGIPYYNTADEQRFIDANYGKAAGISIDYAIMEHASNVYVLPAGFDWNDLGTWGSLHEKLPKDERNNAVVNARVILENAENNIIRSDAEKLIVIEGLNDYIIVDRNDILLIFPKDKEQEIKRITGLANSLDP